MKKILMLLFLGLFLVSFTSALLNDGLVSYWDFDENSGTNVIDHYGLSNGTLQGATRNIGFGIIDNSVNMTPYQNITLGGQPRLDIKNLISISGWVYIPLTGACPTGFIISKDDGSGGGIQYRLWLSGGTTACHGVFNKGGTDISTVNFTRGSWNHLVGTSNGINHTIYLNGNINFTAANGSGSNSVNTLIGNRIGNPNQPLNATIDELGIWNRSLSQEEINQLYNNGQGLQPFDDVYLISPSDNFITSSDSISFNTTAYSTDGLKNYTLFIWNANGSLYNSFSQNITGVLNSTTTNISSIPIEGYKWNARYCDLLNVCKFSSKNYTFTRGSTNTSSYIYNATTTESSLEGFSINISVPSGVTLTSASLIYNNDPYTATVTSVSGDNYIISSQINIPIGTGSKSFYFTTTLSNGLVQNLTSATQTVNALEFGLCGGSLTVPALNFTVWDEQNLSRINPFSFSGTFNYYAGGGTIKKNVSVTNSSTNQIVLCLASGSQLSIDSEIEYNQPSVNLSYITRSYYTKGLVVNGTIQNVKLYLLRSSSSTSFITKVQDLSLNPIVGALINIQRYYPGTNTFETVQVVKTDGNGKSIGFYETETVNYRHIIYNSDGETILTTSQQKIFGEEAPFTLTFTIGDNIGIPWANFIDNPNITALLSYNETTKLITYVYSDANSQVTSGRLNVQLINQTSSNSVICDNSNTGSTGTITCDMSAYNGTFIARSYITLDGQEKTTGLIVNVVVNEIIDIMGNSGLFLGFFIILTVAMVGIWNPTVGIILVNAATILVNFIGLTSFSPLWIFAMLGISITLIALIET